MQDRINGCQAERECELENGQIHMRQNPTDIQINELQNQIERRQRNNDPHNVDVCNLPEETNSPFSEDTRMALHAQEPQTLRHQLWQSQGINYVGAHYIFKFFPLNL